MPQVKLTFEQLRDAVRRLPASQKEEILEVVANDSLPEDTLKLARKLRPKYRLKPRQQSRLNVLVAKRDDGLLTADERRELDGLIDDIDRRMLVMAEEMVRLSRPA